MSHKLPLQIVNGTNGPLTSISTLVC